MAVVDGDMSEEVKGLTGCLSLLANKAKPSRRPHPTQPTHTGQVNDGQQDLARALARPPGIDAPDSFTRPISAVVISGLRKLTCPSIP